MGHGGWVSEPCAASLRHSTRGSLESRLRFSVRIPLFNLFGWLPFEVEREEYLSRKVIDIAGTRRPDCNIRYLAFGNRHFTWSLSRFGTSG